MKTIIYLKYFVHDYIWKQFFASNSTHAPVNIFSFFFDNFGNFKTFNTVFI